MADRTCGRCGQALRSATKFCGGCGASVEPEAPRAAEPSVPPMAMREFEAHVVATLQEGTALGGVLEDLLAEAAALGIDRETALGVIETADAMAGASEPIAVRVWYDAERAGTGVVDGNTLLAVRVENRSGRALQRVRVLVVHPQTQEVVGFPEITTLNKGQAKETDADLVFTRAGRQAVRVGWVEVQWLTGTRVVYRLTDVLQLRAESAGAARTTIHSISQTIQTHGGGVVSAGGLSGVQQPGGGAVAWQEVRLRLSNIDEVTQAEQLAATRAAAAASEGEPTPVPAVVPPPSPPSGLMAVPRSPTSVELSWADNAVDERGFYVERASDGLHFTRLATVSADTVTYLVHGLTPHQAYTFRVQAFNDAGPSDYSNLAAVLMPPEMAAATPDVAQAARETAAVESLRDATRALADAAARHTPVSTVDEPALPSHVPLPAANTLRWVALLASGLVIAAVWAFLNTPDSALSDQQPEYPTQTTTQEAASQTGTTPTEALPPQSPQPADTQTGPASDYSGHLLSRPVNDFNNVIDPESRIRLDRLIRALWSATGELVEIATIDARDGFRSDYPRDKQPPFDPNTYVKRMYDNGASPWRQPSVLITLVLKRVGGSLASPDYALQTTVLVMKQDTAFGMTSSGLKDQLGSQFEPYFPRGEYAQGLIVAIRRLLEVRNISIPADGEETTLEPFVTPLCGAGDYHACTNQNLRNFECSMGERLRPIHRGEVLAPLKQTAREYEQSVLKSIEDAAEVKQTASELGVYDCLRGKTAADIAARVFEPPVKTYSYSSVTEFHYCATGQNGPDKFLALFFRDGRFLEAVDYEVSIADVGGVVGDCSLFVKRGGYREPKWLQGAR